MINNKHEMNYELTAELVMETRMGRQRLERIQLAAAALQPSTTFPLDVRSISMQPWVYGHARWDRPGCYVVIWLAGAETLMNILHLRASSPNSVHALGFKHRAYLTGAIPSH